MKNFSIAASETPSKIARNTNDWSDAFGVLFVVVVIASFLIGAFA